MPAMARHYAFEKRAVNARRRPSPLIGKTDQQARAHRIEGRVEDKTEYRNRDDRLEHIDGLEIARRPHQELTQPVGRGDHLSEEHDDA